MKADTMNIELPPLPESTWHPAPHERAFCPGEVEAFARAAVLADRASRSRAASEPGEVARLADEANALARKYAYEQRTAANAHETLLSALTRGQFEAAIDRLASMATSPASEAQAGWVMVPREPTLEMGWAYLEAARKSSPLIEHVFNHPGYRAMLASAPLPASSPAELPGMWEESDLSGGATDCLTASSPVAAEPDLHALISAWSSRENAYIDNYEFDDGENATHTPTEFERMLITDAVAGLLADEEWSEAYHAWDVARRAGGYKPWSASAEPVAAEGQKAATGKQALQVATPGPRGENAGGVAPAGYKLVSGSAYGQRYVSLVDPAGKIIINAYEEGNPPMFAFLAACATAWGLRIAEKGDAS